MVDMQLIPDSDPRLRTPCEPFDFNNPPIDPVELAEGLVKIMNEKGGIGLAANQVGLPWRVFAMTGDVNYVCFNPRVVMPSEEQVVLEEGCLSYPNLFVKVKRPRHIRVRFQTPNGETHTMQFTGMTARVFQHELDHLDGEVFYNKANRIHRDQAMTKWRRQKRKEAA